MEELNKTWITNFNNNKNKKLYAKILNQYFPEHKKCKDCNDVIYYQDSSIRIGHKTGIYLDKKSYLSKKTVLGNEYYLCVCEDCISNKFPEYNTLNKGRIFNRICDITCYAFGIPTDVSEKWKKNNYAITLENLIEKHGQDEGEIKWKSYCDKQALTNTFEYKKEKYGWNEKKFKEYNKSRAVTIVNLVKKHGENSGMKMWDNYCDRQKYTCSLEYFKNEYGDSEGTIKYIKFAKKRAMVGGYSDISQRLFDELNKKLKKKYKLYYATLNSEYQISDERLNTYYNLDFYIKELNLGIEFNGDVWHCNPSIYKADDKPLTFLEMNTIDYCAKTIWDKDEKRINFLKTKLTDVIIIWERDLINKGLYVIVNELFEKIKTFEK